MQHFWRQDGLDDFFLHRLHQLCVTHIGAVLRGENHRVDGHRAAILIAHRHLALGVGAQPGQAAILAHQGLPLGQAVGEVDRRGHQHVGFVAGKAKHQPLVARPLIQIQTGTLVDTLSNIGRLLVESLHNGAGGPVKTHLGGIVANPAHRLPRHVGVVYLRRGGDLTGKDNQTGGDQRFGSDSPARVLGQDRIKDGVGYLICNFIGMAFGYGLGGEEMGFGHADGSSAAGDVNRRKVRQI